MRTFAIVIAMTSWWDACKPSPPPDDDLAACELADENAVCPECADGVVTCTYGDISATELSCGGCQAEFALYQALCEAGVTDSRDDIEAGLVCEPEAAAACELAAEHRYCTECADGVVTCSFEDTSVTLMSCGGCQAESGLYEALCDAGSPATRQQIEDGLVCVPADES